MIKTIDFNGLAAGTIVDSEYQADGVTVSAIGGSGDAMIFDTANPTGGDSDLATSNLGGVLIVSEDGDSGDPDDNAGGGCLVFDFTDDVRVKQLTFLDIEEAARMVFYDADGNEIANKYVSPTDDGGQKTVQIDIEGVARLEVVLNGSGAVDNLVFDDGLPVDPEGDGIVSGSNDDDVINLAYEGDPEGDLIDAGDALLPGEAPDDDIVDALGGNDDISAEEGDDDVYAGSGDDTVDGGAGDDIIYGDSNYEDGTGGGDPVRESLEWDLVGVPNDGDMGNFTQDTGNTNVSFNILSETPNVITSYETDAQLVDGIEADGDPVNANSSFYSETCGEGQSASYELSFDNPVSNVDFRINDVDGDGVVRVLAYDADGNQIPVNLTGGSCITLLDTDSVAGADTADSQGGYDDDTSATYSVLVDIPGPVARIVIEHSQDGPNNSGINVTDIYFDADDGAVIDDGPDGNDDLFGGAGDDLIFGEGGDDRLTGGEGSDTLSGGDDRDTFVGGDGGDAVDGGTGGNDVDTLDLRDSGPLRIVGETVDADGDSTSGTVEFLDGDGNVTSSMTFAEIERLLLPENSAPTARDDSAVTDEDTPVTIPVLANDSDPDADPLTVTSATSPDGDVVINADGTLEFTPAENFNGETTITYTIDDGNGGTDTAEVTVTVNPVNDAPVATDDVAMTILGEPVTIPVLANDSDPDGDPLTVTEATSPDGDVVINGDGTITFTPADGFGGDAEISYTVSDGNGGTDTATVTVTVRDGIVSGTDDGDLIDTDYDGDPDGDFVDNDDAILPGEEGDDDIIEAGGGDDTVNAGAGNDEVFGGDGSDILNGQEGDDALFGEDGNDTLTGGAGSDTLDGGAGADRLEGNDGDDLIDGMGGDDDIIGGLGNDTIFGRGGSDTVEGNDGDDVIDTSNGDILPDLGYPFAGTDPLGYLPDPEPENDRDLVDGGGGDDTIRTGDDRDTITGGAGNDVIDAGIDDDIVEGNDGDDRIVGGEGNDSILGGDGADTIYAGNDPDLGLDILDIPDEATDDNPFSPDRNPDNGRDTVDGGAGDDVIYGADDDDVLLGGSGNDFLDGQIDDDTLSGGTGLDTLVGGQGDDSLSGGLGNDELDGGIGDDTLRGNRDDDLLEGGDGNDLLDGGGQNDTLNGGDGDDTLQGATGDDVLNGGDGDDDMDGGAGNDIFDGGAGNDDMRGGGDRDTFINVNAGDVVNGNEAGDDFDCLDLTGSAPVGGRLEVEYAADNPENGTVFYFDADNNPAGQLVFTNIEKVVPCFTPGTKIATPKGEVAVEDLAVGDRVITRDNGIQEIRWVGHKEMTGDALVANQHMRPVLIRAGALGNNLPERDMMVSPNHRMLVANDKTALYFEEREVLVAAKHLTALDGIDIVDVSGTTYIHIMFDCHEVILSDGTWTESFQPGDNSLAGVGDAQRAEILELFPELATREGVDGYSAARRSLKKHEAKLLTK